MLEFLVAHGYLSLFVVSFLAATVVPLGSEWLLVALLTEGLHPGLLLASATTGNVLGALTTWAIGVWGGPFLMERVLRIDPRAQARARSVYRRWGSWSLLLSWVPVIGDPLCLVGGLFRIPFFRFTFLVLIGKLGRYAFIVAMVNAVV
ncbi:YqaA family protein [Desulfoluna spongiiphila]|uniref:YqaA family protein n=1 Tax=Desulfoluna spongiiphila TaxID=419481 RepID=UPI00125A09A7|nr:YqaA family protein [Desulfoluna spongiiphila]VVS93682.1 snare associated golgi protein [Desulfoluna spongiiphila]